MGLFKFFLTRLGKALLYVGGTVGVLIYGVAMFKNMTESRLPRAIANFMPVMYWTSLAWISSLSIMLILFVYLEKTNAQENTNEYKKLKKWINIFGIIFLLCTAWGIIGGIYLIMLRS
jgi:NADH:ubiquinone oxidoreductase subunit 6 (subunit J)